MEFMDRTDGTRDITRCRLRRLKKPLIEKRRRERINKSLSCLKSILLENIKRNGGTQTAKMDKADILEMTVTYLRMLQYGHTSMLAGTCNARYTHGYQDCAGQALRYLGEVRCHDNDVTKRLENHLVHTQTLLETSGAGNSNDGNNNRGPLTIFIPAAHAQYRHGRSASTNLLCEIESLETPPNSEKYSPSAVSVGSYTSGYSSQSDANSYGGVSAVVEDVDSFTYDSDRSRSPDDVWRPW